MEETRQNELFLPGYTFPAGVRVTSKIGEAARGKDVVILVTPSQRMRENLRLIEPHLDSDSLLVSASKGIEIDSLKRMTEVILEELPAAKGRVAALSGPNLSREVADEKPTAAVVASTNLPIAVKARDILSTPTYRVYSSQDVVGVELGGALKNIIAIGAGLNDGLGYGENAKGAFIARGLAEISRLGIAAGANPLTFSGMAGIGDLIATCASPLSRNQQLGRRLAQGEKLSDILQSMKAVAEGVSTTQAALKLAARYKVEMPITEQLARVLFDGFEPRKAVVGLMMRNPRGELEGLD